MDSEGKYGDEAQNRGSGGVGGEVFEISFENRSSETYWWNELVYKTKRDIWRLEREESKTTT